MCGRTAQTVQAVSAAASSLGISLPSDAAPDAVHPNNDSNADHGDSDDQQQQQSFRRDNYNLSPGMDALVFFKDSDKKLTVDQFKWGLVSRGGTTSKPLPTGLNLHFDGMMYNARSDTLYEKPTYGRLATQGKTCLVAVDGFFEWKVVGPKTRQPYFVSRKKQETNKETASQKQSSYLLFAGLWTSVPTGRSEDPILRTFTICTTDVCEPLKWLHDRMPVCVWDQELALQWLENPSQAVFRQLEQGAMQTQPDALSWHEVTPKMVSLKFRSEEAIKAMPRYKTVKSFFAPKKDGASPASKKAAVLSRRETPQSSTKPPTQSSSPKKRASTSTASSGKKLKRGSIESFFSPKK